MSLEDFSDEIESWESSWSSAESAKEFSEKFKESQKKAWAKAQKRQKDEKKAKKYDFALAGFLVKIILDKKYDLILGELIDATHKQYPSNFVLGIISLVHIEISDSIRETSKKPHINFKYDIPETSLNFSNGSVDPQIQDRINAWIEDILDSVLIEYSQVQTKRLLELLISQDTTIEIYVSKVFSFFLSQLNISIDQAQLSGITQFILSETQKNIKQIDIGEIDY